MEQVKEILEITTFVITILGVPVAIYAYLNEKQKERLDREYGTYHALDDKYIEFLKLCMENADTGIYQTEGQAPVAITPEQKSRKYILFEILVCLFERAFLMYSQQSDAMRQRQWQGWNAYMEDWMDNEGFREAWVQYLGREFDVGFLRHMNGILEKRKKAEAVH